MHIYFRNIKDDSIIEEFEHVVSIIPDYESTNNCVLVNFIKNENYSRNSWVMDCRYLSLYQGYIVVIAERRNDYE